MNFKEAIVVHSRWKTTLSNYLGAADGSLDHNEICKDNKCALGLWIYGEGSAQMGKIPEYQELIKAHTKMHVEASEVVREINSGTKKSENELIGPHTPFFEISGKMISLLESFDKKFGSEPEANKLPKELADEPASELAKVAWRMEVQLHLLNAAYKLEPAKRETVQYLNYLATELQNAVTLAQLSTQRLLDNAGDGFVSLNKEGIMNRDYSVMAEEILLYRPAGKRFSYIFGEKSKDVDEAIELLFRWALDFDSVVPLLPQAHFMNLRHVEFKYKPIKNIQGELTDLLVIIKDVTKLRNMEKRSEQEAKVNRSLLNILANTNDFYSVLEELSNLENLKGSMPDALRSIHTLKGGFGLFGHSR